MGTCQVGIPTPSTGTILLLRAQTECKLVSVAKAPRKKNQQGNGRQIPTSPTPHESAKGAPTRLVLPDSLSNLFISYNLDKVGKQNLGCLKKKGGFVWWSSLNFFLVCLNIFPTLSKL